MAVQYENLSCAMLPNASNDIDQKIGEGLASQSNAPRKIHMVG
jgi:hypothetical protein